MSRFFQYYGQYQGVRSGLTAMPAWGRGILFLAAIPGIVLIVLSILAFVVSLLALLVLTVPVYRLLSAIIPRPVRREDEPSPFVQRRHVDVKIVE